MYERRLLRLFLLLAALLATVAGRAFWVQVVAAEQILKEQDRVFRSTRLVPALRGEILWADGTPAVRNGSRWSLRIDVRTYDRERSRCGRCGEIAPRPDPARRSACPECGAGDAWIDVPPCDVAALAGVLGIDPGVLGAEVDRAIGQARLFRWRTAELFDTTQRVRIGTDVARALALRAREFPGVEVRAVPSREADPEIASIAGTTRLPWKSDLEALASEERAARGLHVYTTDEALTTLVGNTGIEARLDERFRGVPGIVERPAPRRGEAPPAPVVVRPVVDGEALRTTLRREVQRVANEVVRGPEEEPAAAVVLDLADGAVVAAAGRAPDPYFRPVTPRVPGSVFKLVTALATLEAGIDPDATLVCDGTGKLPNGQRYRCTHVHGAVGLVDAFEGSCNPYFMTRAMDAGPGSLADAYARLGMDVQPRLGLGVAPRDGRILDFAADTAQLGIGQAKALTTPLQVATAFGRLATRGRRIVPYLDRDAGPDASAGVTDPVVARHAALLLDAAHRVVVGAHGTASGIAGLRELDAAGKTGTADVPVGPGRMRNNAWFVAFAPYDAPRFVAVVLREKVPERTWGSTACGPEVARLLEAALRER